MGILLAAIVGFIPANGIKQEFSVIGAAIEEGLAADDVMGNGFDELRHERVERVGILAVGEMIAFQGASDLGFVHHGLIVGGCLPRFGKIGNSDTGKNMIRRMLF